MIRVHKLAYLPQRTCQFWLNFRYQIGPHHIVFFQMPTNVGQRQHIEILTMRHIQRTPLRSDMQLQNQNQTRSNRDTLEHRTYFYRSIDILGDRERAIRNEFISLGKW